MSRWYETAIPQEKRSFFWDDLGWFYLFMAFLFHCWTCLIAATMGDLWSTVVTVFVPVFSDIYWIYKVILWLDKGCFTDLCRMSLAMWSMLAVTSLITLACNVSRKINTK